MLKDEHQALQLAFASLEEKLRKTQVCHIKFLVLTFFFFFFKKCTYLCTLLLYIVKIKEIG